MITVTNDTIWSDIMGLDTIARAILGDNTAGVSIADYSAIVLLNNTPEIIDTASNILN